MDQTAYQEFLRRFELDAPYEDATQGITIEQALVSLERVLVRLRKASFLSSEQENLVYAQFYDTFFYPDQVASGPTPDQEAF